MPLDFRTVEEEEGFNWKRLLVRLGTGIGVFLVFLVIGHYGVAPLIFRTQGAPEPSVGQQAAPTPPPKVEIYEKLPSEITATTGTIIGSREVAPFDYAEFDRKRKAQKRPAETPSSNSEEPLVLVPDEEPEAPAPAPEEPATSPTEPESPAAPPEEPPPAPTPETETESETPPPQARLYRVQVGVYESRENANQVLQTLIASGFEASIVPFQREGRTLYRVQTLVTRDRAKAEQAKQKLESQGFPATIVAVP
ncbi:MAG: SPOR domain-containing protein [Fimbriimonadales bacterium]|jgi:cell division protein FtsN|nr:SPOR domain-containing protein [Fimbriimonadales bacterium]GBC90596.1 Cell division protein DedD [bacterium HR14]